MIVVDELSEHPIQMPTPEDQLVVENLATYGSHPALGESVRAGRPIRQVNHLSTFGLEDFVECAGVLGVPVVQSASSPSWIFQARFLACWATQAVGRQKVIRVQAARA